jgi:hypothetical protein
MLRCFQDVKTRWDSTNNMLVRLRRMKEHVNPYTEKMAKWLSLCDNEWDQIDYVITILRPFAIYTQLIGASRMPTLHQVYDIYNLLITHIEMAEEKLEKKTRHWKQEIYKALGSAKEKLVEYYTTTADSKAGVLYGIAILLDPRKKYTTWQQPEWAVAEGEHDWQAVYWAAFEELYNRDYAHRTPTTRRRAVPTSLQEKEPVNLDTVIDGLNSSRHVPRERRVPTLLETDAQKEFLDYRKWSKFSGSNSGSSSPS